MTNKHDGRYFRLSEVCKIPMTLPLFLFAVPTFLWFSGNAQREPLLMTSFHIQRARPVTHNDRSPPMSSFYGQMMESLIQHSINGNPGKPSIMSACSEISYDSDTSFDELKPPYLWYSERSGRPLATVSEQCLRSNEAGRLYDYPNASNHVWTHSDDARPSAGCHTIDWSNSRSAIMQPSQFCRPTISKFSYWNNMNYPPPPPPPRTHTQSGHFCLILNLFRIKVLMHTSTEHEVQIIFDNIPGSSVRYQNTDRFNTTLAPRHSGTLGTFWPVFFYSFLLK